MTRAYLLAALAALGCGGSPGRLTNERKDPSAFVTEKQPLLVATPSGLVRIALNGSQREAIAPAGYHLEALTADGKMLALGDSDTNLYILDATVPDRVPRRVPELDRRTGPVAIKPDGSVVATTKHADFDTPQRTWGRTEDDTVYLVDTRTLAVTVIPKTRDELVTGLRWEPDGSALVLAMFNFEEVRLDLATRARAVVKTTPEPFPERGSRTCDRTGEKLEPRRGGDEGFDIVARTGAARRLIVIEGRSRGFHDYLSTVREPVFTPSCRYVVFGFGDSVWVADAATGTVGNIAVGGDVRLLR